MTEPTTKEEIPNLCKETFLPWKKAMVVIYVIAGLVLSGAGTAIAWAMTTNTTLTRLTEKSITIDQRQDRLDKQINDKLDILISRK